MSQRIGFFVATEHLVLFLKRHRPASPDVPSNVRKSVARDEWLASLNRFRMRNLRRLVRYSEGSVGSKCYLYVLLR